MSACLKAAVVAVGLLAWGALALALVRRAEASVSSEAPPPWPTAACVIALAGLAVTFRAAPAAATCGTACIALAAAAGADARTGYLFDAVTLPAAALVTGLAIVSGTTDEAAGGVMLLIGTFGAIVALSRGRCMGLGDVKAMFALGAAFGPIESLVAIFAACVCGIVAACIRRRFAAVTEVRFGPHLAAGAAFALVAGDPIARQLVGP